MGLKDAQEYIQKLKKAEKARETKQQVHIYNTSCIIIIVIIVEGAEWRS